MALCAGALREFLRGHGELPDKPLVAVVPMSVHDKTDRPGRNQISGMFCNLQTHIEDPVERLQAIADATGRAKEHSRAIGPTLALDRERLSALRGVLTPASAMDDALLVRLPAAGVSLVDVRLG